MHISGGQERLVACTSLTLAPAELKYGQIEREALAIMLAVRKIPPVSIWTLVYTYDRPPPTLQVVGQQPRCPFSGGSSDAKVGLDTQCIPICIKTYTR